MNEVKQKSFEQCSGKEKWVNGVSWASLWRMLTVVKPTTIHPIVVQTLLYEVTLEISHEAGEEQDHPHDLFWAPLRHQ